MDLALTAVFCGLTAAIALGIADFQSAKAARFSGPITASVAVNCVGAASFALFYIFAFFFSEHTVSVSGLMHIFAAALFFASAEIALYKALKIGPVSLVSPLTSIYPLFVTLGVVFFFNANFGLVQTACVAIILLGTLAASGLFNANVRINGIGKGPVFGILTAFLWGIGYIFLAKALESMDWQTVSLVQLTAVAALCAAVSPIVGKKENVLSRINLSLLTNRYVFGTGILQMLSMVVLCIGLALSSDLVPVVTAVSACYPVLTILLALRHFDEEYKLIPLMGAALCIVGIVALILNTP